MLAKSGMFKRSHDAAAGSLTPASATGALTATQSPRGSAMHPPAIAPDTAQPAPVATAKAAEPAGKPEAPSGSKLIVGPDVKLKGAEILDCDTLVVEGRVEATMDSRVIQIAADGAFSGKVGIDVAEVHGRFDGELTARNQLIIRASGRVSGKIRYGRILIEEGGVLSGDVAALAEESPKTGSLQLARSTEA